MNTNKENDDGSSHGERKHASGIQQINVEGDTKEFIETFDLYLREEHSYARRYDTMIDAMTQGAMDFLDSYDEFLFKSEMKNLDRRVHHPSKEKENATIASTRFHSANYAALLTHTDVYMRQFSLANANSYRKQLRRKQLYEGFDQNKDNVEKERRKLRAMKRDFITRFESQMFPVEVKHSLDEDARIKLDNIIDQLDRANSSVEGLRNINLSDCIAALRLSGKEMGKSTMDGVHDSVSAGALSGVFEMDSIAQSVGFNLGSGVLKGLVNSMREVVKGLLDQLGLGDNPIAPVLICMVILLWAWKAGASKTKLLLVLVLMIGVLYAFDYGSAIADFVSTVGDFVTNMVSDDKVEQRDGEMIFKAQAFSEEDMGDAVGMFLLAFLFPKEKWSVKSFSTSFTYFDSLKKNFTSVFTCIIRILQKVLDYGAERFGFASYTILSTCVPEVDDFVARSKEFLEQFAFKTHQNDLMTYKMCSRLEDESYSLLSKYGGNKSIGGVAQIVRAFSNKLSKVRSELEMAGVSSKKTRQAPLIICFSGGSQIGKSTLIRNFVMALLMAILPESEKERIKTDFDSYIYARQPEQEFWDGYFGQLVCIFDELHLTNDKNLTANNALTDIIRCGNEFPNSLHMAGIEQKGNTYFRSEIIICTTNCVDQVKAAMHAVSYPEAVANRFHYDLRVNVRAEYATAKTREALNPMDRVLDLDKLPMDGSFQWDTLEFVQQKRIPKEGAPGSFEYKDINRFELRELLIECIKKYTQLSNKKHKMHANDASAVEYGETIRKEMFHMAVANKPEMMVSQMFGGPFKVLFESLIDPFRDPVGSIKGYTRDFARKILEYVSDEPTLTEANADADVNVADADLFFDCVFNATEYSSGFILENDQALGYFLACCITKVVTDTQIAAMIQSERFSRFYEKNFEAIILTMVKFMKDLYKDNVDDLNVLLYSLPHNRALCCLLERLTDYKLFFLSLSFEEFMSIYCKVYVEYHKSRNLNDHIRREIRKFMSESVTALGEIYNAAQRFLCSFSRFGSAVVENLMSRITNSRFLRAIGVVAGAFFGYGIGKYIYSEYLCGNKFARKHGYVEGMCDGWTGGFSDGCLVVADETDEIYHEEGHEAVPQYLSDVIEYNKGHGLATDNYELYRDRREQTKLESQNYDPNLEDISKKVWEKNFFSINFEGDVLGYGWFSHDRVFNLCSHFIKIWKARGYDQCDIVLSQAHKPTNIVTYKAGFFISHAVHCGNDLACVVLSDQPCYPDIRKFQVSNDVLRGRKSGRCVMFRLTKGVLIKEHLDFKVVFNQVHHSSGGLTENIAIGILYQTDTKKGECGSPIFLVDPSTRNEKFVGFHVAGSGTSGLASTFVIKREDEPEFKSEMLDFVPATMKIIGSVPRGPGLSGKTRHVASKLHGAWGPAKKRPARLHPFKNADGVRICPMSEAIKRYNAPILTYDDLFVKVCSQAAVNDLVSCMRFDMHVPTKRTMEDVVFGVSGERFMDSIPRNTSSGLWWSLNARSGYKGKERFFGKGVDITMDGPDWKELHCEIMRDEQMLREGKRPQFYYGDALKDELVSHAKAAIGKTRLFCPSPVSYYILFNMYFKDFFRLMMDYRIVNESAVGINVYSDEWDLLARKLTVFGADAIVAGDFGSFDALQSAQILREIGEAIIPCFADREYDIIRRTLWCEIWNSKHVVGKLVLEWLQSLPSGNPATTLVNTIFVMTVMRMAYVKNHRDDLSVVASFSTNVSLIAYGDDHVLGVAVSKRAVFNQHTITSAMTELGLIYTAEDKTSNPPPFRNITEIEFLKRRFRYEDRLGRFCAPLRLDTVLEMPYWSKRECYEEITRTNFSRALLELSLYEAPIFDEWSERMLLAARDRIGYVPAIMDRDALMDISAKMEDRY